MNTTTVAELTPTSVISTVGVPASSLAMTLKKADLNWEPLHDTVGGMDTAIVMPRKKILYRSDNKQALGIVGEDYAPSSPKEFIESQFEFAEFIKGKVTRAGFIAERSRAFAFVKLTEDLYVQRKTLDVGDPCSVYIYSTDGWDGGTPRRSRLYIERLACKNGNTSKELSASLWVSHTSNMEQRYEKRWKQFLGEVRQQVEIVRAQFNTLGQTAMTKDQMLDFAMKLIPGDHGRSAGRREEIVNLFANGIGTQAATRWDAYNAVTEYVTHHKDFRKTDSTSIETNRFLGVVETDTLSRTALSLLLN